MAPGGSVRGESAGAKAGRAIGHGLWILIPILSFTLLSWLPAAQAWWRSRSAVWLIVSSLLLIGTVTFVSSSASGYDGAELGALIILLAVGGVVAAAFARPVFFGRRPAEERRPSATPPGIVDPRQIVADPSVQAVLYRRERRAQAREIAGRDPAMAYELRVGRPDLQRTYDDGGLMDLNNVGPDALAAALGWPRATAEAFAVARDLRGGYTSLDEVAALSGLEPALLERDAERLILLPHRPA